MYKKSFLMLAVIFLFIVAACSNSDNNPTEQPLATENEYAKIVEGNETVVSTSAFTNGDMENSTTGYWKGGTSFNGYSFLYSNKESVSPSHSLSITAVNAAPKNFVYWAQTIKTTEFAGKKLTLTVWTKYENVDGDGIMFVLRGDDTETPSGYAEAFATTQSKVVMKGSSGWKKIDVTLKSVPDNIKCVTVYMLMASQNGTVYFDNLEANVSGAVILTDVVNGDFETGITTPDDWWTGYSSEEFEFGWETKTYSSASHSAKISSSGSGDKFTFWAQTITAAKLTGKKITLKVKVKSSDLSGNGLYIAIRGDNTEIPSGSAEVFSTTQGKQKIVAPLDWKEFSVTLDTVPNEIKSLTFYLIYGTKTSGTVYLDDVSLTSN